MKNEFYVPWNDCGVNAPAFSRELQEALDHGTWSNAIHPESGKKVKILSTGKGLHWFYGDIISPNLRQMRFRDDFYRNTPDNYAKLKQIENLRGIIKKTSEQIRKIKDKMALLD